MIIASYPKYYKYPCALVSVVYKFFDEKVGDISTHTRDEIGISENQEMTNELHKPIYRKLQRSKVY